MRLIRRWRRARSRLTALGGAMVLGLSMPTASAVEAPPLTADPALEAHVMRVAEELRCLVCQNETIAASQADLAVDLRKQIRLRLQQGESEAQILDFMVARYSAFVRYRPAFDTTTALLWIGPFALLPIGAFVLARNLRERRRGERRGIGGDALSEVELQHVDALLRRDAAGS